MRAYQAEKRGALLVLGAFVQGPRGRAYPRLLLDTGSAYSMIAQEILESIGCSPANPKRKQRIITGSGYEIVPVVAVTRFSCLGQAFEEWELLAHTLPFGTSVEGLLGMDFLTKLTLDIRLPTGEILIR